MKKLIIITALLGTTYNAHASRPVNASQQPTWTQEHRALLAILKDHDITLQERIIKLEGLKRRVRHQDIRESIDTWIGNTELRIVAARRQGQGNVPTDCR